MKRTLQDGCLLVGDYSSQRDLHIAEPIYERRPQKRLDRIAAGERAALRLVAKAHILGQRHGHLRGEKRR